MSLPTSMRTAIASGRSSFMSPAPAAEFIVICVGWPGRFLRRGASRPADPFCLHPLAVEDALLAHQLLKVDIYGDQLFVVVRSARLRDGWMGYRETSMFVGPNHIITVRHGSARAHNTL